MPEQAENIGIAHLMDESGVKFGTSGARGLVADMSDRVCYAYTLAFVQYLRARGDITPGTDRVALAGDYRSSTGRIMTAVARAVTDAGYQAVNCGRIPSPAVALFGLREGIPAIMVTGSHIPDDRNGIKYNTREGEILKRDEAGIRNEAVTLPLGLFDPDGGLRDAPAPLPVDDRAYAAYLARYLDFFPPGCLDGLHIGLYEHSSVARECIHKVLAGLGARVTRLGRSEAFVPVDTEAIRPEDVELARTWAAELALDAIVSTDGDGDRPLISDAAGQWLRGDVAGILCARYLGADSVVTPVSSNSAVERCGWFASVRRTRIGSPYVIEAMHQAVAEGGQRVAGYEANGGFLTASPIARDGRVLDPLPTRDTLVVLLSILCLSRDRGVPVSALLAELPQRFTASDRLKAFPTELSQARLRSFQSGDPGADRKAVETVFGADFGQVEEMDDTDGLRITFENGEVVHLRPSGNAPEFRCYNEADSEQRAAEMNRICMGIMQGWRDAGG